jgi:drug/metabolite transporter (DMT)-like permease
MPDNHDTVQDPGLFRAHLMMHGAVVLYGLTGILGRLIELPSLTIVWYRMLFTLLSLCLFPGLIRTVWQMPRRQLIRVAGIGMLLTLHWLTFFGAIKLSNVSITLSCLASTAFFTALIEPIVFRSRIRPVEVLLGAGVILGFVFIFGFVGEKYGLGIFVAILSAVLIALVVVFNKVVIGDTPVYAITFVEFLGGMGLLSLVLPLCKLGDPALDLLPTWKELAYLLVLALICTTLAYNLTLTALKKVSAFHVNLAINLEPIYAIVMAWLLFSENEELNAGFYAGTGIILLTVFAYPVLLRWFGK